MISPIFPCLWFDGNAKQAAEFYTQIFPNSRITAENPFVVSFELNGRNFIGLNGGPQHPHSEAISLCINCETQEEIDYYWENLLKNGGKEKACGWLSDQFGVCWQIVPDILGKLMSDPEKAHKTMQAFMKMVKFDIAELLKAAE